MGLSPGYRARADARSAAEASMSHALWVDRADVAAFDALIWRGEQRPADQGERNMARAATFRFLLAQAAAQQEFEAQPHLPAWPDGFLPSRPPLYAGIVCADCRGPVANVGTDRAAFGVCYQGCKGARERVAAVAAQASGSATQPDNKPAVQGGPAAQG